MKYIESIKKNNIWEQHHHFWWMITEKHPLGDDMGSKNFCLAVKVNKQSAVTCTIFDFGERTFNYELNDQGLLTIVADKSIVSVSETILTMLEESISNKSKELLLEITISSNAIPLMKLYVPGKTRPITAAAECEFTLRNGYYVGFDLEQKYHVLLQEMYKKCLWKCFNELEN